MSENPLWLVSFLISTSLSFFSVALVVEISMALFRIRKPRTRSILRLFPMLNLFLDFFFSKLSTGNLLNPLHCESCIQKLLLSFTPELKQYLADHQIAWSKHLASQIPGLNLFLVVFCSISLVCLFRKTIQIALCSQKLTTLIKHSKPCTRSIETQSLQAALQHEKVKLLMSDAIQSPMAVYLRTILLPQHLLALPQEEFEAILAHELEHLRWKDPLTKFCCQIGSALVWWVPTQWWLKRIDQDQELAADTGAKRHQLNSDALAAALVKTVGNRYAPPTPLCEFAGKNCSLFLRLQMMIDPAAIPLQKTPWWRVGVVLAAGSLITLSCLM